MLRASLSRRVLTGVTRAVALAAGVYAGRVAIGWFRYGRVPRHSADGGDRLLDTLMPRYEVVERHSIRVAAPASLTLQVATDQDLLQSAAVRAIFKARELMFGSPSVTRPAPRGLLEEMTSIGWAVLAEVPGHELVLGAVTQPWEANVVFHPLARDEFVKFRTPGFVKIAWTLRVDPTGDDRCVFRTETRAIATDADARRRFRRYWAVVSPGVSLIRSLLLGPLRREAERRSRQIARSRS